MKQKLILCALVALACGCAGTQVPKSKITFDLHAGTGALSLPKDADVTGLNVSVGTNGMVQVHVDHLAVKMSPDVIQMSGQATAQAIEASGNVAAKVGQAVAAGMVQGAKTP